MKRSVRLTATLWGAALLLSLLALASLVGMLVGGVAPVFAASAVAAVAADATATITPTGSPTPAAVPTISAGSAGSIAPAAPALTGATIATALTCVTTLIGLVIAIITLSILLRGGYGPFLRAMIFGAKRGKGAEANSDMNDGGWDASHTLNYRPGPDGFDDPFAGYGAYDDPVGSRRSSRGGSRGRGDRSGGSDRRGASRPRRNGWE
jgi:hypothetical protein